MRKLALYILTLTGIFVLQSCDSTEPNPDVHPNITWKVYKIETFDSYIQDLFIIDRDCIWVVGEIWKEHAGSVDSLGNLIKPFNIGIWNGEEWKLQTVFYKDISLGKFESIWAFDRNDVWLVVSSASTHWDGKNFTFYDIPDIQGPETRIWGASNKYLYLADNIGKIVYYDGASWKEKTKFESENITDLWGVNNSSTLFACYDDYNYQKNKIFKINADAANDLKWDSTKIPYHIWTDNINTLWAASQSVWKYENENWQEVSFSGSNEALDIKGNSQNDIYVVGRNNLIAHFNGMSWKNYDIGINEYAIFSILSVKDDVIAFVGRSGSGLYVVIGYVN